MFLAYGVQAFWLQGSRVNKVCLQFTIMADQNQTLVEPLLQGLILRGARYGMKVRMALLCIAFWFAVRMYPAAFTRNGFGQSLMLQGLPRLDAQEQLVKHVLEEDENPVIENLRKLEDSYRAKELEFEKHVEQLRIKHMEQQAQILRKRCEVLTKTKGVGQAITGTPACRGFWCQALQNHEEVPIEEWDVPVLEYLKDVTFQNFVVNGSVQGGKLTFVFAENPYFFNKEISKEYHVEVDSASGSKFEVTKVVSSTIEWKPGMSVTVGRTRRKVNVKNEGVRMTKQKLIEAPRRSFFRSFFRNLEFGKPIPIDAMDDFESDDFEYDYTESSEDDDESESESDDDEITLTGLMERDYETAMSIKDTLIPCATRWYTSEAAPTEDDDEELMLELEQLQANKTAEANAKLIEKGSSPPTAES